MPGRGRGGAAERRAPARRRAASEENIARSAALYAELGAALEAHASRDVKARSPLPLSKSACNGCCMGCR